MNAMIRTFAAGALMSMLSTTSFGAEKVDVWVLLSEPPVVAEGGSLKTVDEQQQSVLTRLHALGGVEIGRVKHVRNALAVSIDSAKLSEIKRIPGVRSVSPVQHIERDPPTPPVR